MVADLSTIDEIKCRATCLKPKPGDGNLHEYEYCRCDIDYLLKHIEELKEEIKKQRAVIDWYVLAE